MRGNHRLWGRQDYTEPAPIAEHARLRIAECTVTPRDPARTQRFNAHAVIWNNVLVGYVATRLAGQMFRTPDMAGDHWFYAANEWHHSDPPHGLAVMRLLDLHDSATSEAANGD